MPDRLLSVVIPVYNASDTLPRCFESIGVQSHDAMEVLLIDDGSTDESGEMCRAFARADERVRYIRQENLGVSAARNSGLAIARGDLVSFVDSDDWLEPDAYAFVVGAIADGGVDVVAFDYFVDHIDRSVIRRVPSQYYDGVSDNGQGVERLLATHNRFACTRVFRRDVVGPTRFRANLHWGEDTVFVYEVMKKVPRSQFVRRALYHYVQSEGSATRGGFNEKRLSGMEMTEVLEGLVAQDYPGLVDYVLRTRVNIAGELVSDLAEALPSERGLSRSVRDRVRADLRRMVLSRRLSSRVKMKAILLVASPELFRLQHLKRIRTAAVV